LTIKPVLHLYVKGITSRSKFFVRHSTIVDKLLWSSKSVDWHKVVKQALGRLTLFFTTVNHCHCQTHHCKMLNTEKWTTEGDIRRRKN
jgi:hypothetical protein